MFSLSTATSCVTASPTVSPPGHDSFPSSAVSPARRVAEGVVRRDAVGELADEDPEVLGPRDEVGLAVDLEQHRPLDRDVGDDEPLRGRPAGLGGGGREPLLAEDLPGFLEVALGFHEGLLAVHHSGARLGAQVGNGFRRDFHGFL